VLTALERELAALRAETSVRLAEQRDAFVTLQASHADTIASRDAAAADLRAALATRERELAALRAEATAQLSAVHAVVTSKLALELHPVRGDRRQFATLHVGPVPFHEFDSAWCTAACGRDWKVDIDPVTHTRARVKEHSRVGSVTLRGPMPLPRRLPGTGASPQQLPSYRVIIDAYPAAIYGDIMRYCNIGFVPSHTYTDGAAVTPVAGRRIRH
jgi:hypothetical protein